MTWRPRTVMRMQASDPRPLPSIRAQTHESQKRRGHHKKGAHTGRSWTCRPQTPVPFRPSARKHRTSHRNAGDTTRKAHTPGVTGGTKTVRMIKVTARLARAHSLQETGPASLLPITARRRTRTPLPWRKENNRRGQRCTDAIAR